MTYLLDTNVCIRYLNGTSPAIRARLQALSSSEVAVCSVVKAELFAGAGKSVDPERTLARQTAFLSRFVSMPFDDRAAAVYGQLRSRLEMAGTPLGPMDYQIAAIALANDLVLVTHNLREFSRVDKLRLDDWETQSTTVAVE